MNPFWTMSMHAVHGSFFNALIPALAIHIAGHLT